MYAAVAYWGFKTQSSWVLKIIFGIGLPILIAVLWSLFLAPKATRPLRGLPRELAELSLFGFGSAALFASGKPNLGWVYLVILAINKILLYVWKQ